MDLAKKAEAKYAKGARTGALEGLPIGIKDESYIKGKPTSNGSLIMKDYIGEHTSPMNERIIKAGGIVHARTATPEFSCAGYTWSRLWGVTRNPWNRKFTPGGSSGGAAASLASGTSAIATGSDIGGSIRIPASTCGLVGYKPPYGRNPDDPPFNLDFYCHTGPLARTVEDAIILQNVMSGPSPLDISTLRPKLTLPTSLQADQGLEDRLFDGPRVLRSGPRGAEEHAGRTRCVPLAWRHGGGGRSRLDRGGARGRDGLISGISSARRCRRLLKKHGKDMTTYARQFAQEGQKSKAVDFVRTLDVANKMYSTLGPMLEKYNVLICPTTALAAVPADFDHSKDSVKINGKTISNPLLGWVMTTPFNTMSRCPVLSVPSGHAKNGVPTGIQIVGRTYCDADVFRAAMAYETAQGQWFKTAASRPSL